jgi:hypothetical protein
MAGLVGLALLPSFFIPRLQDAATMAEAEKVAGDYLSSLNNKDLAIDEIMEFTQNFYVVYYEKSTGMGAFEMVIDKPGTGGMMMDVWGSGTIRPEQGPDMMWNTKYGGMIVPSPGKATITEDQAKALAQKYMDTYMAGGKVEDVHAFYGYYTVHIEKDGRIYGMLSVNAYDGEVWYHNWHGAYIQTVEMK